MQDTKSLIIDKIHRVFKKPCNRVLFIQPFQFPEEQLNVTIAKNRRYFNHPPYGVGILCANLKQRYYSVYIVDLNMDMLSFIHREKDEIGIKEKLSNFWKQIVETAILDFAPDIVGITCMYTMSHGVTMKIVDFIKGLNEDLPVVAGGVHITNAAEVVLRANKGIDFISLYEGDESFCIFLDFINNRTDSKKLTQLSTLINGKYVAIGERTPPDEKAIDVVPDYLDMDIGRYSSIGEVGAFRYWFRDDCRNGTVLTNRGCRGRCSFCSVRNFNGNGVRARSISSVIDEIEQLISMYGINHISWMDDDLFYNHKRAIRLFDEIRKRNLGITWDAMNGIIASVAAIHPELIHAAAESGCVAMNVGLESGNPEILKSTHKPSTIKHYIQVGELMRKYPQIFTRAYLIIGFPKETLGQLCDTVNVAREMSLDWNTIARLRPLPSTEMYEYMVTEGLVDESVFTGERMVVRESEIQREREKQEMLNAKDFVNLFESASLSTVPTERELDDVWLIMDYKVNYEKILKEEYPVRLKKMRAFLKDISNRMSLDNPLAFLFLGIVEYKTGNVEEADRNFSLSKAYLVQSRYWQKRFDVLGLNHLDESYKINA